MKKITFFLLALICSVAMWADDLTVTWSTPTAMTYTDFVAMAGTSRTFGLQAVSSNAATYHKWFGFTSATSRVDAITTSQEFTLEGTASAAQFKRVSDSQYLSAAGTFGETAMDVALVNRTAGDYSSEYTAAMQISIDNSAGNHYNANSYAFAAGTGGWSAYVAFETYTVESVEFTDEDGNALATALSGAILSKGSLPSIDGYTLTTDPTGGAGINGTGSFVFKFTKEAENDWAVTLPADLPDIKIGDKANSITAATAADDNDHWFIMTQVRGGESPMYDNGTGASLMRASTDVTPTSLNYAVAADNTKYLVRFAETETSGVYNIQFATGNYIQTTMTTGKLSSAGNYFVYNIASSDTHIGWNLTTDGTTYGSIVDNNAAGGTLAFWSSGQITATGGNNDWSVYPVTFVEAPTTASVTYNYVLDGSSDILYTNTQDAYIGDAYPTPALPSTTHAGTDYFSFSGTPAGTVTADGGTYTITVTENLPFTVSTSVDDATWYTMTIGSDKYYLNYVADATSMSLSRTTTTYEDADQFCFMGNVITGFTIYNKAAGSTKVLSAASNPYDGNTGGSTYVTLQDKGTASTCQAWDIQKSSNIDGGIYIAMHNIGANIRMNNRSGILAFWNGGADAGSTFLIAEVTDEIAREGLLAQLATYQAVEKIAVTDGATVISPTEYNYANVNTAIDNVKAFDTTDKTIEELRTELNSDDISTLSYYKSLSDYYGYPLSIAYTAKVNAADATASYNTIIMPVNFTKPSNWTLYTCSATEGDVLTLTEATSGVKNTPYIVLTSNTEDETFQIIGYANGAATTDQTAGYLTGVLTSGGTSISSGYVLQNQSGKIGFYQVSAAKTVPLYHCYLMTPSDAKVLNFPGEATAIETVKALTSGNAKIYDVNGRQINKLQKGINIVNGVKVLVK